MLMWSTKQRSRHAATLAKKRASWPLSQCRRRPYISLPRNPFLPLQTYDATFFLDLHLVLSLPLGRLFSLLFYSFPYPGTLPTQTRLNNTYIMAQIRGTAGYNLGHQSPFATGPGRQDATSDPSPLETIREQTSKIEDWLDTLSDPIKPYVSFDVVGVGFALLSAVRVKAEGEEPC